jgi:hypothetical protein
MRKIHYMTALLVTFNVLIANSTLIVPVVFSEHSTEAHSVLAGLSYTNEGQDV